MSMQVRLDGKRVCHGFENSVWKREGTVKLEDGTSFGNPAGLWPVLQAIRSEVSISMHRLPMEAGAFVHRRASEACMHACCASVPLRTLRMHVAHAHCTMHACHVHPGCISCP